MVFQQIFSRLGAAFVLSALPLSFMAVLPTSAKAANLNFDRIYVFGDSLSDDGNVYRVSGGAIPQSPPYYDGRFSNGPVWVEQLAPLLGLQPDPDTNFAFGGSTTGLDNVYVADPRVPGLLAQVQSFTKSIPQADPNALYTVWAGTNDYLAPLINPSLPLPDPRGPVDNLGKAVTLLANAGAKNILVVNLSDLGETPLLRGNSEISGIFTNLSNSHDLLLAQTIKSLSETLGPDIHITSLDVNSLFDQVIADPAKFGFTDVTDACLASVGLASNSVPCTNPDDYLFWDDIHPTTKAHKIIAQAAYSALSVPEPSDVLGILVIGAAGAVLMHKRKHKQPDQFKAEVLNK